MPIYTYKCESCEKTFEYRQRMLDEPLSECTLCSDGRVRRVINSVGVVFKGNGFYVTDSRKNGAGGGNGAAKTGDGTASSTPDAATEKKSEPPAGSTTESSKSATKESASS